MKLNVLTNKIITSAHYEATPCAFNLIINTTEKWIPCERVEHYNNKLIFVFMHQSINDSVTLTAENDHDIEILHRLRFELHEKNQLWILFPVGIVADE